MSLFNRAGNTPDTIIINRIARSRNESFGQSFMADAALAVGPAAAFTNNVYRKKAMKDLEKRNRELGAPSEYLNQLCNLNVGDNVSAMGNYTEANLFTDISAYCRMEMLVKRRNDTCGGVNEKVEEMLANPPALYAGHGARVKYIRTIEAICTKDLASKAFGKHE